MISIFQIRQGASVPILEVQITKDGRVPLYSQAARQGCVNDQVDNNAVDLSGASIAFELAKCGRQLRPVTLSGEAAIVDSEKGIVKYTWHTNDTAVKGLYYGTFVITLEGAVFKWPYQQEALSIEVM